MTLRAAALLLLLLLPRPAAAWLREGHMATGAMVFDLLRQHDPAALATILRTARAHPDRPWFDRALATVPETDRDRFTLELMAVWPDAARNGPFDHDDWHYDQTIASSLRDLVPFSFGGAIDAFNRNLRTARDPAASDADRALALCWVLHIVGDMHQPLHATVWIGWRFPLSDAGGNWAWIRRTEAAVPERLHWFWDSAARPPAPATASPDLFVATLERRHPFRPVPVADPAAAFAGWVAATRHLAYTVAYANGTLRPGVSPADAPVLDPALVDQVRTAAADQIAHAGNRTAALLLGLR